MKYVLTFHPNNTYLYMHWINVLHRSYYGVMFTILFDLSESLYYTYLEGEINLYCKFIFFIGSLKKKCCKYKWKRNG